jgi:hypothetical protein
MWTAVRLPEGRTRQTAGESKSKERHKLLSMSEDFFR